MLILLGILCVANIFLPCRGDATLKEISFPDFVQCYQERENFRRTSGGNCGYKEFPTKICTSAVLSPIMFDINGILDLPSDSDPDSLSTLSDLKKGAAPGFKTYINLQSDSFSEVISNSNSSSSLLQNVRITLEKYNLSGVDFFVNITSQYKNAYEQFLVDANQQLSANNFDVIISVLANPEYVNNVYNVSLTSDNVFFVVLRTDLFYDSNSKVTVPNDPIFPASQFEYNMQTSVEAWLNAGINPFKLMPTLALSGLSFITHSSDDPSVNLPVIQKGDPGSFTQTPGYLAYYEICTNPNLTVTFADKDSYAVGVNGQSWISYTTPDIAGEAGTFVLNERIKGIAVNDICLDDYNNICENGPFPLTSAALNAMFYGVDPGEIGPRGLAGPTFAKLAGGSSQLVNEDAIAKPETKLFDF